MTICPIAIVAGCHKCPAFKICPLKGLIGDKPKAPEPEARIKATSKSRSTMPAAKKVKAAKEADKRNR